MDVLANLPEYVISSIAIIVGAVLGGIFSWLVTKNSICKNVQFQKKLAKERRMYCEMNKKKMVNEYANIIRLDICTALFMSIRCLKDYGEKGETRIYPLPMNSNYANAVSFLKWDFDLKELSYIYQLYGIIEKVNYDFKNTHGFQEHFNDIIIGDSELILKKVYGNNMKSILDARIDQVRYEELFNNDIIKPGYRKVLQKLNNLCTDDSTEKRI